MSDQANDAINHLRALDLSAVANADAIQGLRQLTEQYGSHRMSDAAQRCERISASDPRGAWFVAPDANLKRPVLYLHGGGWSAGSVNSHEGLIAEIAACTGRPIFALDYALAPEQPFPCSLNESVAAVSWIQQHGPYGPDACEQLALIGDSAGANLAAGLIVSMVKQGAEHRVSQLVLLGGVFDCRPHEPPPGIDDPAVTQDRLQQAVDWYLGGDASRNDSRISPVLADPHVLSAFPPTLIQASSTEYLRDQSVSFAQALWTNRVPARLSIWPGLPHVWHLFVGDLDQARQAIDEISAFLGAGAHPVDQ